MVDSRQYHREEYTRLRRCELQARQIEGQVRELPERADGKRSQDIENVRKWNRILDRLEVGLDEAKARLAACEQAAQRQRRRAEKAGLAPDELNDETFPQEVSDGADSTTVEGLGESLREILGGTTRTPDADAVADATGTLDDLSAEEVEGIEELTAEGGFAKDRVPEPSQVSEESPDASPEPTRDRPRRRLFERQLAPVTIEDRRRHKRLQVAVDKLLLRRFNAMTIAEVDLVLSSTALLHERSQEDPGGRRITETLTEFVGELPTKLSDWQRTVEPNADNATNPQNQQDRGL